MKRKMFLTAVILLFFVMIFFPAPVFKGASSGLLLWFYTVLPTLLPFLILSDLMLLTNAAASLSRLAGPLFHKTFGVSDCGAFAVLTGFLCGYPMGAKITAQLVKNRRISLREGEYLLSFCNNASPMFLISFVLRQNLKKRELFLPSLFILFLSPLLCSFLFRKIYRPEKASRPKDKSAQGQALHFRFEMLDFCIMDSFEALVKIGGYIMIFSVLIHLLALLPQKPPLFRLLLLPMLEITNGISMISKESKNLALRWVLMLSLTSFGGVCAAAQTSAMTRGTGLSVGKYLAAKLTCAAAAALLSLLYLLLFGL